MALSKGAWIGIGVGILILVIVIVLIVTLSGSSSTSTSGAGASTPSTPATPATPAFKLVSATYGVPGANTIDVTSKFSTALDASGNLTNQFWTASGSAYNTFFGTDPDPYVVKIITVTYKRNGIQNVLTFKENVPIALP
jgi:hypothetical protein